MIATTQAPTLTNAEPIPLDEIPVVDVAAFRKAVLDDLGEGSHLAAFFGLPVLSSLVPAHPTIRCLTFLRLQTQRRLYNIALIWGAEIVRHWLTNCLKTDQSL